MGLSILGWRTVPNDPSVLGPTALACCPLIQQLFVAPTPGVHDDVPLEKKAFLLNRITTYETGKLDGDWGGQPPLHWSSFSSATIVYKIQGLSTQVGPFFADIRDRRLISDIAICHSRFSTNTFPSWSRAQPLGRLAHNGEINTLVGNQKWMYSRHGTMSFDKLGVGPDDDREFLRSPDGLSDTGCLNAVIELLTALGRPLPDVMSMLVPESWQNDDEMSKEKKAYYEYMSCLMEPWDGPALLCFTDGDYIGATLDRSGLRPAKFYELSTGVFILASEFGVVDVDQSLIVRKGRLSPGKMLLLDLKNHKCVNDVDIKSQIAQKYPYDEWLSNQVLDLDDLPADPTPLRTLPVIALEGGLEDIIPELTLYGWSLEAVELLFMPMLANGMEALGSMGNDAALAFLRKAPLMFDFFKQLFAQVTNPPLDSTREYCVMSLECMVGPEGDLAATTETQCNRLRLKSPVVSLAHMASIKSLNYKGWTTKVLDMTFAKADGVDALDKALERLKQEAEQAVKDGFKIVVLSDDQDGSAENVPIAALLAVGAVHQHLVNIGLRLKVALMVDTGEAREVHHMCVLVGFGADAICPRVALEMITRLRGNNKLERNADGTLPSAEYLQAKFIKAIHKGMLKVMAKMGISTLQSYKGAQIFEAVGLAKDVMDKCFTGTASRIGGLTMRQLCAMQVKQHAKSIPRGSMKSKVLPNDGYYNYRSNKGSEVHLNDPMSIHKLQEAARTNSPKAYADYARMINDLNKQCTIRGLLKFKACDNPIPLEEVEPASEIVKRFCTGAMSYGSISIEAHQTLALAMNAMGGKSNSGEGGEAKSRYELGADGSLNPNRSAIKQIASGRFGVTADYLTSASELQIKMAQGAKPGEGGELPGFKVVGDIAVQRHSTPGVGLISPPPHHDIYSIEDLKELIFNLKNSNPAARVSVKLVSEVGVGVIASGVAKGLADHILISGHDGGTGASRWTGIKNCGLPWELGLAETHQTLVMNDLRKKVVVQTDGQLKTGRDIVIGCLLGAEEFGFATAPLIAMGCIMMRKCHLNTCPVGIATQDPELRKKFKGTPEHVQNFLFLLAEEARGYMAQMGFKTMEEMVGRADMLEQDTDRAIHEDDEILKGIDLSPILKPAHELRSDAACTYCEKQEHGLDSVIDATMIKDCAPVFEDLEGGEVYLEYPICNTNRATGCMLSHTVTKAMGAGNKLKDGSIHIKFEGSSGQSLGCWLTSGITLELEGDANDYVAKGLCGGRVIVYPPKATSFKSNENEICGNVCLYGATSGQAFLSGRASERFCVRNSGASAVVEGVGDHGCEYMTGGRAVILGSIGRNFAAGMSGGIAYIYNPVNTLAGILPRINTEMVKLGPVVKPRDVAELKKLLQLHRKYTKSKIAAQILTNWQAELQHFTRVMPEQFRQIYEKDDAVVAEIEAAPPSGGGGGGGGGGGADSSTTGDIEDAKTGSSAPPPAAKKEGGGDGGGSGACCGDDSCSSKGGSDSSSRKKGGEGKKESPGTQKKRNGRRSRSNSPPKSKETTDATDPEDALLAKLKRQKDAERSSSVAAPVKKRGFIAYARGVVGYRKPEERLDDWKEIAAEPAAEEKKELLTTQAARCMDCGVPFCHQTSTGCPLGNRIPEWNQYVYDGLWEEAYYALAATNNFPEFTGRVCPAPCEGSCVLGIIESPVSIKNIECSIIDRAFAEGWITPSPPAVRSGKKVAVVGSGPAGLACADQLNKMGHLVTLYERADRIGGLMMYGVPNMKCDKEEIIQRRVDIMAAEGITFLTSIAVGKDIGTSELQAGNDALVLATGATLPRDLPIEGRKLGGVHFAMEFLSKNTKSLLDKDPSTKIDVKGKSVVVIGGGDTGNDCIGTSMRHGATSVVNFELLPQPPAERAPDNPWPQWPRIYRVDYGHEEVKSKHGKDPREYCVLSKRFVDDGNGKVSGIETVRVEWTKTPEGRWNMAEVPGSEHTFPCDYVFLAMGFLGPDLNINSELSLELDGRKNFKAEYKKHATSVKGVFAAGDCRRGQSLVVWAIAEGRNAAEAVDGYLQGV